MRSVNRKQRNARRQRVNYDGEGYACILHSHVRQVYLEATKCHTAVVTCINKRKIFCGLLYCCVVIGFTVFTEYFKQPKHSIVVTLITDKQAIC